MNNCGTAQKKFVVSFPRDCHAYARNDIVLGLRPKQKSIQSALINGMCLFEVSVRKANAEISAEQDGCTRMRGTVLRKPPRRRSGITSGRYFSMRVPPVFPASDG